MPRFAFFHLLTCLSISLPFIVIAAPTSNVLPRAGPSDGPPGASGSLTGPADLLGADRNPINTPDSGVVADSNYDLVSGQSEDADLGLYLDLSKTANPQPFRGDRGGTDPGPRNLVYEKLNPDLYAPPGTDDGDVPNLKWPMGLSHTRLLANGAGWARRQTVTEMPAATAMSGVDLHLEPHAYRELHWHRTNEWTYVLNGSVRIGAINDEGQTTYDDLVAGDVWFFPAGHAHGFQAFDQGAEFILVFDDGLFSEENDWQVSELFLRTPQSVIAKDLKTDVSAFANIPSDELYVFPGPTPPSDLSAQTITGPAGPIPLEQSYTYHFSQQEPYVVNGGTIKIVDPSTFPIASNFSAALITIRPGAMREIHWHTTSDEWAFFIAGNARMTVFQAPGAGRTFDFQEGDVGYVPYPESHYIENTGDVDLVYLEVLRAPKFTDISVAQWLGLTPPQWVKDTLHLPDAVIANLPKYKNYIVPGNRNLLTTNFTGEGP